MAESFAEYQSIYRARWVGYCFLLFALIDTTLAFIPPRFSDPTWKLQTIGKLVETVAIPILGFALVFWGEHYGRQRFEKLAVKILSWLCLGLSIVSILLIPPLFLGGLQLETQLNQVSSTVIEQQLMQQAAPVLAQLQQFELQLNQSGPEQIKKLGTQLNALGGSIDTDDPQKLKSDILAKINQKRAQTLAQVKAQTDLKLQEVNAKKLEIRKNSVKWSLGGLLAGVLFFILWRTTPWARS